MKIPKRIKINGYWWTVLKDKKLDGGSFTYLKRVIRVNPQYVNLNEIFLHEVMEILMVENQLRFPGPSDTHFRFFMDHDQFTRYSSDLYTVLYENKLL